MITGTLQPTTYTADGKPLITLCINERQAVAGLQKLESVLLDVEITKHVEARSKDANAYMWTLCHKIAQHPQIKSTKLLVYKKYIREVGQFEIVPIKNEEVEKFQKRWARMGYGWFADPIGKSKIPEHTNVMRYYGSSVYDSHEMWILTEEIINTCHELEIETRPEEEIKSMCERYGK